MRRQIECRAARDQGRKRCHVCYGLRCSNVVSSVERRSDLACQFVRSSPSARVACGHSLKRIDLTRVAVDHTLIAPKLGGENEYETQRR